MAGCEEEITTTDFDLNEWVIILQDSMRDIFAVCRRTQETIRRNLTSEKVAFRPLFSSV